MKIPMEDWLRGCVYHDGRNGKVTLPTDKVIEIANYIQATRTGITDGIIYLPPNDEDIEAISIAIQSLEQETCNDCISRKALLDELNNKHITYNAEINKIICDTPAVNVSDQPTIYCKDCYYWTKQKDSLQGRCSRYGFYPTGYYYCAGATKAVEGDEE